MQSSTAKMVSFLADFIGQNCEVNEFEKEEQALLTAIRNNLDTCCAAVVQERVTVIEPNVKRLPSVIRPRMRDGISTSLTVTRDLTSS